MALEMCVRPSREPRDDQSMVSAVELLGDLCPTPTLNRCVLFGAAGIEIIEIRKGAVLNGCTLYPRTDIAKELPVEY